MNSNYGKKTAVRFLLLTVGAVMMFYGIWRGEAELVLGKAIKICLECVGIG